MACSICGIEPDADDAATKMLVNVRDTGRYQYCTECAHKLFDQGLFPVPLKVTRCPACGCCGKNASSKDYIEDRIEHHLTCPNCNTSTVVIEEIKI